MAKLIKRKLNFTENFYGFRLKVEFTCDPKTNTPKSQYDYSIDFVSATTAYENVDIHLLAGSIEKINLKISEQITERAHKLYMDEEVAHQKWLREMRGSSACQHSDLIQQTC